MLSDQREQGRRIVLDEIRRSQRVARVDLARRTGISQATVTTITAELMRQGLIEEVPRETPDQDAKRGRPRIDLKLRGSSHIVGGIKIAEQSLNVVLLDFEGTQIAQHRAVLDNSVMDAPTLASVLERGLRDVAAQSGITLRDISAVGVGMAGIVDVNRGFVCWSPCLADRNVALQEILSRHLEMPVFIDNDANLVAMAEQNFGYGRDVRDFIVVTIESGVGMGIVLGNELYRGTRGCGAEFGHTKVQLDGALCRCGQRGCLEAYVADYALLREAATTTEFADRHSASERLQALVDAARAGDETAQSILDRAGRMFAMGLANIVNIFDPQLIILSGERMQFDYLYAEEVLESIRKSIVQVDTAPPEVRIHKWGDLMWAKGAAAYAIDWVAELALKDIAGHAA